MIRRAAAVIGANYGDEGKGVAIDAMCRKLLETGSNPIVVRANGGCQAAHTVQLPSGKRWVFKTHGSATLIGVPTFLSSFFIVNPISFAQENPLIQRIAPNPIVFVDRRAIFSTPFDMLVNQIVETARGANRHGSCGWGINETVRRCEIEYFRTEVRHMHKMNASWWEQLRKYTVQRLEMLGLPIEKQEQTIQDVFFSDNLFLNFMKDCKYFLENTMMTTSKEVGGYSHDIAVFEGAQGLGLDEDGIHFPHVTRSKTGIHNPALLCQSFGAEIMDVLYLTRAYNTRHGAGPLEGSEIPLGFTPEDPTNVPNNWQGSLRFAPLHYESLKERIIRDIEEGQTILGRDFFMPGIGVTCLDQLPPEGATMIVGGQTQTFGIPYLLGALEAAVPECGAIVTSYGPTHQTWGIKVV